MWCPCNVLNVHNSLLELCRMHKMSGKVFPPFFAKKVCVMAIIIYSLSDFRICQWCHVGLVSCDNTFNYKLYFSKRYRVIHILYSYFVTSVICDFQRICQFYIHFIISGMRLLGIILSFNNYGIYSGVSSFIPDTGNLFGLSFCLH